MAHSEQFCLLGIACFQLLAWNCLLGIACFECLKANSSDVPDSALNLVIGNMCSVRAEEGAE